MDATCQDGVPEFGSGLYAYAGEEKQQTYFTQHEVGGGGGVGVDFEAISKGADEDGHNERAAGQTEFHSCTEIYLSDKYTKQDAEEDGTHVRMVEAFHAATDGVFHLFYVFLAAGHQQAVAHLKGQVAVGEKFHAVACYACHVYAVDGAEVKLSESFSVDFVFGDDQAA